MYSNVYAIYVLAVGERLMSASRRISTTLRLDWSKDDLERYSWLKKTTRHYSLDAKLGKGAFGTTFEGYPFASLRSKKPLEGAPKIVVKLPNIDLDGYTTQENRQRLDYIRTKNLKEFNYFRKRLGDSIHANPIIDLATLAHPDGELELPVTIQLYLDKAYDLNNWLIRIGLRPPSTNLHSNKPDSPQWSGIGDRVKWVTVALQIARAIKDIHLRRVRHGDIHPGNVFLRGKEPTATLIDFGEGFLATPDLNWRHRNPNPYLAPERSGPRFPLNEQVDVYSFGMLLLYLATGAEREISLERHPGLHRAYIHDQITGVNPSLVRHEPRISDLIGRSTARDPADRPRMIDICEALQDILDPADLTIRPRDNSSALTLDRLTAEMEHAADRHSPVLLSLLDKQIRELASVFDGLQTEMVELYGTRDQMLRNLISVMEHLQEGDSWTTATTLAVWQRSVLGLNGSFMSANIRAVRRGVAIRRTFVVSIAELGIEFSDRLASELCESSNHHLNGLGKRFRHAIDDYAIKRTRDNYRDPGPDFIGWHRQRLRLVLECLRDVISIWELGSYLAKDATINIERSQGLYFGFCPVATLDDVGAIKEENPVSLMHFAKEQDVRRKWLLVTLEVRGRDESKDGFERPHLLGVRVYKSVMGKKPSDRIQYVEKLMNKSAANVTSAMDKLAEIVNKVHKEI